MSDEGPWASRAPWHASIVERAPSRDERAERATAPGERVSALRLEKVSRRFGHRWALRRVDLEVPRGTVLAVVGANGAGKTTLLRIAATVLRPSRGSVEVFGMDAGERAREIRGRVGLLAHQNHVYAGLTARENLRFAAEMHGLDDISGRIEGALVTAGLLPHGNRLVRTFSSGMKRRLALAATTIHRPELLFLDEPYGALDAEGLAWVDRLLSSVGGSGGTVVVATHHVERVLPLAGRVLWLVGGIAEYLGPASGVPGRVRKALATGGEGR